LILFEIPNDKEVEVVYEENSLGRSKEDWYQMYNYATNNDHDFMFINYMNPKKLRVMKNFDQFLINK
jgi:hypothetical protein